MTFKELQDDTLERLGYDNTTSSSAPRTRIKRFLNFWQRRILSDTRYSRMRHTRLPLATVVNQFYYGLPPVLETIDRIYDNVLNNPPLILKDTGWIHRDPQSEISTGTPRIYVNFGLKPISRFPAATGTGIWVASSAAGDTTQSVRMDAIRVGGYPFQAGPTTLNGVTRVQIGTRTDYVDIEKLYLSAVAVGDISIFDAAAAGNTLGVIPIGKLFSRYQLLQLYPVPSSVITYQVDGKFKIFDMAQDTDEPLLPEDYHHVLGVCAAYTDLRDVRKQLGQSKLIFEDEIQPLLDNMLDWLVNTPDYIIIPEGWARAPWWTGSNLGSWYPLGRWAILLFALLPWLG